jgi:hypothetical protein
MSARVDRVIKNHQIRVAVSTATRGSTRTASGLDPRCVEVMLRAITASSEEDFTSRKAFLNLVVLAQKIYKKIKAKGESFFLGFLEKLDKLDERPPTHKKVMAGCSFVALWTQGKLTRLLRAVDSLFGYILGIGGRLLKKLQKQLYRIPSIELMKEVLDEKNSWERELEKISSKIPAPVRKILNKMEEGAKDIGTYLTNLLKKSRILYELARPLKIFLFIKFFDWYDFANVPLVVSGLLGTLSIPDLMLLLPSESLEIFLSAMFPWIPQALIFGSIAAVSTFMIYKEVKYLMEKHGFNDSKALLRYLRKSKGEGVNLFEPSEPVLETRKAPVLAIV